MTICTVCGGDAGAKCHAVIRMELVRSASEGADRYAEGWRAAQKAVAAWCEARVATCETENCEACGAYVNTAHYVRSLSPSPPPTEPDRCPCGLPYHFQSEVRRGRCEGCTPLVPCRLHHSHVAGCDACAVADREALRFLACAADAGVRVAPAPEAQPPPGTEHRCTGPGDCDARGEDHQRRNNEGEG